MAWLDDRETWSLLPQPEVWDRKCYMREAAPDRIRFPPLTWESCGDACERADVLQGHGTVAGGAAFSTAISEASTSYLRLSQVGIASGAFDLGIQRVIDLRTGVTRGAVQDAIDGSEGKAWCAATQIIGGGLDVDTVRTQSAPPHLKIRGIFDRTRARWSWQLPWPALEDRGFDAGSCDLASMEPGGRSFYFCGSAVHATLTPGSSETTVVEQPIESGFVTGRGVALDDTVVWSEQKVSGGSSRIRAWKPDGDGVRTILEGIPADVCAVGLSDAHAAGFATAGGCGLWGTGGRFWIADRNPDGTLSEARFGPVFWPEPVLSVDDVATWGNHVAMIWNERYYDRPEDRQRLILTRTTDWAMRDVRSPEGYEVWRAALTDEYLYVVFTGVRANVGRFTHVYRYDLSRFDEIGEPLQPVADPPAP